MSGRSTHKLKDRTHPFIHSFTQGSCKRMRHSLRSNLAPTASEGRLSQQLRPLGHGHSNTTPINVAATTRPPPPGLRCWGSHLHTNTCASSKRAFPINPQTTRAASLRRMNSSDGVGVAAECNYEQRLVQKRRQRRHADLNTQSEQRGITHASMIALQSMINTRSACKCACATTWVSQTCWHSTDIERQPLRHDAAGRLSAHAA